MHIYELNSEQTTPVYSYALVRTPVKFIASKIQGYKMTQEEKFSAEKIKIIITITIIITFVALK